MKKRTICMILTLVLLLGLLPVHASAASPYYERTDTLEAGGEYVLALREESTVRGGTRFVFTQDGTVEGSYSIKGSGGYLVATRSALNCNSSSVTAQASWNITLTEDGAATLQNNTSSKYYLLYSDGNFTISKTAGDPVGLYDADGNKLTALPDSPFEAYICNAEGTRFLSDAITADDAEKTLIADYLLAADLSLENLKLMGRRTRDVGGAGLWQYRDGKLYGDASMGLNEKLDPGSAPDPAVFADGKLKIGTKYLTVSNGVPAMGEESDAVSVQLWKKVGPAMGQSGTYLAITSDIHYKFKEDFAVDSDTGDVIGTITSADRLCALLDQASEDFGGVSFEQFISCGDQGDANTKITGANYWERVRVAMETVASHEKILGGGFFINGNHEWANGQYSSIGSTNEVAKRIHLPGYVEEGTDYVIYSFSAAQTNNSFNAADITALDEYLKTAPVDKPIFIVSHYPLHNFNRSEQRRDDVINVLNSYADDLQIIFLWGHNHTEEDPFYGVVYCGDNVPADMDITTPIKFAYVSAGCMTDDEYDAHAVATTPKGMIAYIAPDRTVTLTYYDVNYKKMSTTTLEKPANAPVHEHSYEAVVTEPTCTEGGYITYICACGDSYVVDAEPALGHDFGEWTGTKTATCTEAGEETRTCTRCGEGETREIQAPGHAYVDGVCTRCGEKDPEYVPDQPKNPFMDVAEEDYFHDPVLWAFTHDPQITTGTDTTHFSPNEGCTRAQVVTFLWRAVGKPTVESSENPFKDVPEGEYYTEAVRWAVKNGVTTGTDPDRFSPDETCTRAQIVTFLWRAENKPAVSDVDNPFTDVPSGEYYTDPVLWAVRNGITTGTDPDKFSPADTCTRGQIVTFLFRDKK